MFAVTANTESALGILAGASFVYLLILLFLLWLIRSLELRLLALGLLTGLLAVWCGALFGGDGVALASRPGSPGETVRVALGSDPAGLLGRIAVLLILGSLAQGIASRIGTFGREEATRVTPG